jgi:hypothetical protein
MATATDKQTAKKPEKPEVVFISKGTNYRITLKPRHRSTMPNGETVMTEGIACEFGLERRYVTTDSEIARRLREAPSFGVQFFEFTQVHVPDPKETLDAILDAILELDVERLLEIQAEEQAEHQRKVVLEQVAAALAKVQGAGKPADPDGGAAA